jgi:hypothetical protein
MSDNYIKQIEGLIDELDSILAKDIELKQFIEKCRGFAKTHFPSSSTFLNRLQNISTEPKGSYFPEMYAKLKGQALDDCKISIEEILKSSINEYQGLIIDKPFDEIIIHEESQYLEFKSTLCWDVKSSKMDKKLMGEIIMKSISAFSNSEGGILLIGVDNDKRILGLADDYKTFNNGSGNRDDFELYFTTLVINNFSKTFAKDNLSVEFPSVGKKEVCLIRVKKGSMPYTVRISDKFGQTKEKFFIRVNNSSRDIDNLLELAKYIKCRFPNWH